MSIYAFLILSLTKIVPVYPPKAYSANFLMSNGRTIVSLNSNQRPSFFLSLMYEK